MQRASPGRSGTRAVHAMMAPETKEDRAQLREARVTNNTQTGGQWRVHRLQGPAAAFLQPSRHPGPGQPWLPVGPHLLSLSPSLPALRPYPLLDTPQTRPVRSCLRAHSVCSAHLPAQPLPYLLQVFSHEAFSGHYI